MATRLRGRGLAGFKGQLSRSLVGGRRNRVGLHRETRDMLLCSGAGGHRLQVEGLGAGACQVFVVCHDWLVGLLLPMTSQSRGSRSSFVQVRADAAASPRDGLNILGGEQRWQGCRGTRRNQLIVLNQLGLMKRWLLWEPDGEDVEVGLDRCGQISGDCKARERRGLCDGIASNQARPLASRRVKMLRRSGRRSALHQRPSATPRKRKRSSQRDSERSGSRHVVFSVAKRWTFAMPSRPRKNKTKSAVVASTEE